MYEVIVYFRVECFVTGKGKEGERKSRTAGMEERNSSNALIQLYNKRSSLGLWSFVGSTMSPLINWYGALIRLYIYSAESRGVDTFWMRVPAIRSDKVDIVLYNVLAIPKPNRPLILYCTVDYSAHGSLHRSPILLDILVIFHHNRIFAISLLIKQT